MTGQEEERRRKQEEDVRRKHQGAHATTDTSSKINYDRRDDATCQLHRDYDGTEHSGDRMSRDCASL